jgi:GH15 family glucan-1,4-alpha-glucosidase
MPRELVLGNGNLLLCFDADYCLRDFYYPHVGMYNHIGGHKCRVGIWTREGFRWVDRAAWKIRLGYQPDSLVSDVHAHCEALGLDLRISDSVHVREPWVLRRFTVRNLLPRRREIRLFLCHDFSIQETPVADTAVLDPFTTAMIHYKHDYYFLINGASRGGGIYQYATGLKGLPWAEGTWRDAEDGLLEGRPICQGSVDSVVSFHLDIEGGEEESLYSWIVVGTDLESARRGNAAVLQQGVERLLEDVDTYWRSWANNKELDFGDLPTSVVTQFKRSLLVVRTQVDNGGAIIAANDTEYIQEHKDSYSYMWPRDGALVAMGLDRAGYSGLTRPFFRFCARALSPGGFLWHKYTAGGAMGSSWLPWIADGVAQLPIQEDETALVLHSLWHHYRLYRDIEFVQSLYEPLIRPAADFLCQYRDRRTHLPLPSWDLWEERRGVHTFTAAATHAGIRAGAAFAARLGSAREVRRYERAAAELHTAILSYLYQESLGRFVRTLIPQPDGSLAVDGTPDSSLFALFAFGILSPDDTRVVRTLEDVRARLSVKTAVGGAARYWDDYYFRQSSDLAQVPGNPWFICTLWLALWDIARAKSPADLSTPAATLEWAARHANESGLLAEQLHPYSGIPLSVSPLTWSHSSFIVTVLDYLEKRAALTGGAGGDHGPGDTRARGAQTPNELED